MKKIIISCLAIMSIATESWSQDFHLSQYDAAALNVNPALTGAFQGEYRLHTHFRNQWLAVTPNPFTTGIVGFDLNKKAWGVGGQIANFRAGIGNYNVLSVMPSFAYKARMGKKKQHFFNFGIQIGFFQKSINASSLTFANQYVKTNGGEFNTSLSSGENIKNGDFINLDIAGGFMYTYGLHSSRFNPFVGATFYHLNQPTESFLGEENKLPIRSQVQVGARWALSTNLTIIPKVFFQYQEKAEEINAGLMGQYYIRNSDLFLLFGCSYRNDNDAVVVDLGGKYGGFTGRISYDINISTLKTVSNGRGATELSLTYVWNKPNPTPLPSCPKF